MKGSTLFNLLFLFSVITQAQPVEVEVKVSPVGSFTAHTSEIEGVVTQNNNKYIADLVKVKTSTLKTGIELRDEHLIEKLQAAQFPEIILVHAEGEDGKGIGTLKIKGIEKKIEGSYVVKHEKLIAEFKISLKDFKIDKIKYLGVGVKDELNIKVELPIKK